jgi:hypothetical protein
MACVQVESDFANLKSAFGCLVFLVFKGGNDIC